MGGATNFSRLSRRFSVLLACAVAGAAIAVVPAGAAPSNPSAGLEQCRNGSAASPADCQGSAWATGNAGDSNSHYVEGRSMPYRAIMSNLPVNTPITLNIEYDTTHSGGQHAIDFLTHYDRLAENVDPTDGVAGISATVGTFAIPAPSSAGSPVAGQPTAAFNALPAAERQMTLFGGTITGIAYVSQGDVSTGGAQTAVGVTFTVDSKTAVMAWGGHIARSTDWGAGNSAAGISGSPYHMRLDSWTLNNLGNTDRSFSVAAPAPFANLTVTKIVVNNNGGTAVVADFPLFVSGTAVTSGTSNVFASGSYSVSETNQAGYTGTIGGDCAADGTITLNPGDTAACTITNDDQPATLTVTKIVSTDDGGTAVVADFPLFVSGTPVTSGAANTFDAGAYTVSETNRAGYAGTIGGDCAADGTITLSPGQVAACTITNDDVPATLTVTKIVVNDDGGTAVVGDFDLFVGSTPVTSGSAHNFDAGTYTVSEDNLPGYVGTIGGDCAADGSITLSLGETAACTITNDDIAPEPPAPALLTVRKIVVNDDDGTAVVGDFDLFVDADQVTSGAVTLLDAGTYTVSEGDHAGYDGTIGGDCDADGSITLAAGDVAECTITNDDIPADEPVVIPAGDGGGTTNPGTNLSPNTETEGTTQTQGGNPPVEATTVSVPPADVPKAIVPETIAQTSPTAADELPRTGTNGLREETLLGVLLMLAGLLARGVSRRTRPSDI